MIRKSGNRFSEKIMLQPEEHDPRKLALGPDPRVETGFPKRSCSSQKSMIRKSGNRFSEKIMLQPEEHDPRKLALGLDPRVETGFPKDHAPAGRA
jgi:hypothetical protein